MLPHGSEGGDLSVHSFVLTLPPGEAIPPRISRITGISDGMLKGAITPGELARLIEPTLAGTVCVAHFASFERRWISSLLELKPGRSELPGFICTREIARRLYPRVPRKGIRALAGYMGFTMAEFRRAEGHVHATVHIWKRLLGDLRERGITNMHQLEGFLSTPVPVAENGFRYALPREDRLSLPDSPGVYRFLSRDGSVLYAGKASSLRGRVNSYFTRRKGIERTLELVSQVHGVAIEECATPLEAAMLEFINIRRHDPPYNVALRDRGAGVSFISGDLRREMPCACAEPAWGPVRSRSPALLLGNVLEALGPGGEISPERLGLEYLPFEEGALEEGLELFRLRVMNGPGMSVSELLATGRDLWLEMREGCTEVKADEEVEDLPGHLEAMDAEGVCDHLAMVLASGARDLRRGAWFRLLGWSAVVWEPSGASDTRAVCIEAGSVASTRWLSGGPVPRPRSPRGTERRGWISGEVFDMLSVLDSEVRRITADGSLRSVYIPGGGSLGIEEMLSLYRHV